ncbi:hypothetical protein Misp01_31210 [Microtetraspora sp. NBRC 13810]|nr:hypothetical protein Misp01_31210 [Microtetraspora sp. NBRC 13810]
MRRDGILVHSPVLSGAASRNTVFPTATLRNTGRFPTTSVLCATPARDGGIPGGIGPRAFGDLSRVVRYRRFVQCDGFVDGVFPGPCRECATLGELLCEGG